MRRALVLVAVVGVLVACAAVAAWAMWDPEPPEPVVLTFDDLPSRVPAARIRGVAHTMALVRQDVPGDLFRQPRTYYVYGLFPPHDVKSRAIRLLVRTEVPPDPGVAFEYLEVEGWLHEPDRYSVPLRTEEILAKQSDYFFADDIQVIEPWTQRSYDPAEEVR